MKTLADFKKRLIVGQKLQTTHHLTFAGRNEQNQPIFTNKDLGVRPVSIVQSNSFALKTVNKDGKEVDSWCSYPKAKECVFKDDNTLTILEEQRNGKLIPVLTYQFID